MFFWLSLIAGISEIYEIAVVIVSFAVSWLIISYSIKNFGPGHLSKKDIQKEFQVFAIILVFFLLFLVLAGVKDYAIFAIAVGSFTITWAIRSAAIKKFSG